jgi:hypothetical protein
MQGSTLITEVRQRLRDVVTTTSLGSFYSDATILMFLNHAQIDLARLAIKYKKHNLISQLITTQTVTTGTPPFTLNANYLHAISAMTLKVASPALYYPCEVVIGGKAGYYWDVNKDMCLIIGTNLYFKNGRVRTNSGNPNGYGQLYYYRIPITIINGTFTEEFGHSGYRIIVDLACLYLAIKDIKGQREFKDIKTIQEEIMTHPSKFAHFIRDIEELTGEKSNENSK